ncbi:MAG: hypothetical protein GTO03_05410, partial [Planctomycetales bacterium]|nr:hypothetical protein [Planctomycetales bacterium]
PQVRESLAVSDSRLAAAAVAAGEADVGFVGERPAASPLAVQEIAEDELVLVVSREHPLAQKGTLTLKQLCREPLIVREPGSGTRGCVERALEAQGMAAADLTIVMEVNNNDAIRRAVERGVGMAFFSRGALRQARRLVPLKVRGLQLRRQLYVIRDRRRRLSPAADEFLQFLDQWRTHPASRRGTAAPRRRKTRAEPGRL